MVEMFEGDFMSETIKRIAEDISRKKEELVKQRLKEYLGNEIDLIAESKRLFPRLAVVRNQEDGSEHYYWNDGTVMARRIISFYSTTKPVSFDKNYCAKLEAEIKYD